MFDGTGTRILRWVGSLCLPTRGRILHYRGKVTFRLTVADLWWTVEYSPARGYRLARIGAARDPNDASYHESSWESVHMFKKRKREEGAAVKVVPLPATSLALPKAPILRQFVSETQYDDGSSRIPGYFTLRNKVSRWELTVYDPDAGLRLPCGAPTIDGAFELAEKLLGTEDAPWEYDQYLSEQMARRNKKKK